MLFIVNYRGNFLFGYSMVRSNVIIQYTHHVTPSSLVRRRAILLLIYLLYEWLVVASCCRNQTSILVMMNNDRFGEIASGILLHALHAVKCLSHVLRPALIVGFDVKWMIVVAESSIFLIRECLNTMVVKWASLVSIFWALNVSLKLVLFDPHRCLSVSLLPLECIWVFTSLSKDESILTTNILLVRILLGSIIISQLLPQR